MTPGERAIEGMKEVLAIAKGEQPAASIYMNGHNYVPLSDLDALVAERDRLREALTAILDKLDSEEHLDKINNKHSQGWIAWWQDLYDKGRAALAKGRGNERR